MAKLLPTTNGGFPMENVNPEKKREKEFNLQFARAALGTYNALPERAIGWRSRDRYQRIKEYAHARQPIQKYLDILTPQADNDENGFNKLVVSDNIIPVIVKPRRTIITLLKNASEAYDVTFNPIDPQAAEESEAEAQDLKARVALRQSLKMNGMSGLANSPAIAQQPGEPEDLNGAEVDLLGKRHQSAMKCELVVKQVLDGNSYPDIIELQAADYVDYGAAVTKDDTSGCKVVLRRTDLRGFICSPCIQPDFSDIRYAGEIREILVSKLIADTDGQVNEEDLKLIYNLGATSLSGPTKVFYGGMFGTWSSCLAAGKVQVLDLEYLSTDRDVREERKNKYGNLTFNKVKENARYAGKMRSKKEQNAYRVKWIVGTDIVYDYGPQFDVKLDPHNTSRAKLSYNVQAADVHDMVALSRTELLMDFADQIQLRRMKVENRFNTAAPSGWAIDMSGMDKIAIDAAGKEKMSPQDILSLMLTHGVLYWRSEDLIGDNANGRPPITEMVSNMSDVVEYWNDIQRNLELMNQLLGLNEVTDGSAPDPKRLTVPTQAAVAGTNNALADLFSAARRMEIAVSESVLVRAQYMMRYENADAFVSSLGAGTTSFIKAAPSFDAYRMGVSVEDRPSPDQVQAFEERLGIALKSGQITIGDDARIRGIRNLKERDATLVYLVNKNKDDAQAAKDADVQNNTQSSIQSAAAAAKMEMDRMEREYQLKAQLSLQEHQQIMDQLTIPALGKNEDSRIAAEGRVESSFVQATGRDATNIRDNKTTLIKEGQGNKTPEISDPAALKTDVEPLTSAQQPIVPGIEKLQKRQFSFVSSQPMQPAVVPEHHPELGNHEPEYA